MAYILLTSASHTTLNLNVSGLDTSWNEGTRYAYWRLDGGSPKTSTIPNSVSSGGAANYSSLKPQTSYYITVDIKTAGGLLLASLSDSFSTAPPPTPTRPTDWAWESTIISGSNFAISAAEWNRFTAKINAFRQYKSIPLASFTTAIRGGSLTSAMYNEVASGIGGISGTWQYLPYINETGTKITSKGNIMRASYFTDIKKALNSIT